MSMLLILSNGIAKKMQGMGNTHSHFLKFEKIISLTSSKEKKLIASRKALEKRIKEYFKTHQRLLVPQFWIQGSYKMKTMVVRPDGTYDVDLGVYFLQEPGITSFSLKENVFRAVNGHTTSGVEHRDKCVRVVYNGDFDIDLPVYYKTPEDKHPYLATKSGWMKSDPKELCDWFESKKNRNGQLVRLVKYFKAWANQQSRKMPSGIAFTVWVADNYIADNRDDRAFFETAQKIESAFGGFWKGDTEVINPATPNDNLLKLDFDQRTYFKETFRKMIKEADQALQTNSNRIALNTWSRLFGNKFPII